MSILLDALRKSENSRRQVDINTLHLEPSTDSGQEPLQMGSLVLVLVAALFFSGWFVWRQYQLPVGSYRPPVTLTAERAQNVPNPPAKNDTGANANTGAVDPGVAGSSAAVSEDRTPVESFQAVATTSAEATAGATSPAVPVSGTTGPETRVKEKLFSPKPEPIGYWDLPDAVRTNVPEMKFNVLVFAANPNERFVLIGGQRLREGDSYRPGLVVSEIRSDGVIFEYRLYQFLVER